MSRNWGFLLALIGFALIGFGMVRGPGPDWNKQESQSTRSVFDQGEIAGRVNRGVGEIARSGRVLWMTKFDDGLPEIIQLATGTGAGVALRTADPYIGANAVELTTGNGVGDEAVAQKMLMPLENENIGLEGMFSLDDSDGLRVGPGITFDDGSNQHTSRAHLEFDGSTKRLVVATGAGASPTWVEVTALPDVTNRREIYHHMKVVIDPVNLTYVRVIFDGVIYKVDASLWERTTWGFGKVTSFNLAAQAMTAANHTAILDAVVITTAED